MHVPEWVPFGPFGLAAPLVIGSPGITRGCSGSGAYSNLNLLGIITRGPVFPQIADSIKKTRADHVEEACTELGKHLTITLSGSTIFACFEQYGRLLV